MKRYILGLTVFVSGFAHAASELKVQGDLMVHPDQVAKFFDIASAKIQSSAQWDWPSLNFAKPYKTAWSGVAAKGPFNVKFDTVNLKNQEVGFELDWNDPLVTVNRFEIHDVVSRQVGGVNLIINLDGVCSNMAVRVPAGAWKVKGNVKWVWGASGIQVSWKDFTFAMNGQAQTSVDLGQCQGAGALQQELKKAIDVVSRDQAWMQDVLRDGLLDWVAGSMGSLQTELLKTRDVNIKEGITLSWVPSGILDAGQGRMRIPGQMVVSKTSATNSSLTIERGYDVPSLASVNESGFILPRGTIPRVVEFMQRNGELGYRAQSKDIDSFVSLMHSRFMQFFVWPDLMSFPSSTNFYFDLSSQKAPAFANGVMLQGGGIRYDVSAPLVVNQWAPYGNKYVPYVDFSAPLNGTLSAKIADGKFTMQLKPTSLNVSASFRREYSLLRQVTAWIATSLLGSRVSGYLEDKPVSFDVPAWELGEGGMSITMRDIQLWKYSTRIPLEFKNK